MVLCSNDGNGLDCFRIWCIVVLRLSAQGRSIAKVVNMTHIFSYSPLSSFFSLRSTDQAMSIICAHMDLRRNCIH